MKEDVADPKLCQAVEVSINSKELGSLDTVGAFYIFLCDKCDKTHVVFGCAEMHFQFSMALDPEEAEKLANSLVNPGIPHAG